jgi:transposase
MLLAPTSLKVFAHRGATDMRKSFSGLVGLIETQLGQQVESGHLFLFFNRRRDRVKVLYFVGDGLVIFYKRLELGTFEVPTSVASRAQEGEPVGVEMRWSELALILEGIELSSVRRRKWWRREIQPA